MDHRGSIDGMIIEEGEEQSAMYHWHPIVHLQIEDRKESSERHHHYSMDHVKILEREEPFVRHHKYSMYHVTTVDKEPSVRDQQHSMYNVKSEQGKACFLRDHHHSMDNVKTEQGEEPSAWDCPHSVIHVKTEEEEPSVRDQQHSMDNVKTEQGEEPSAWDCPHSMTHVKTEEEEPSVWDHQNSMDNVKTEEVEEPSARNHKDSMYHMEIEDREMSSAIGHQGCEDEEKIVNSSADGETKSAAGKMSNLVRKPNFSDDEVTTLRRSVREFEAVLFPRGDDRVTKEERAATWEEVTNRVNKCRVAHREILDVKKKWSDMMRVTKGKRAGGRKKARLSRDEEDRSSDVSGSDADPGQNEVEPAGSASGATPQDADPSVQPGGTREVQGHAVSATTPKAGVRRKTPQPGYEGTAQPSLAARTRLEAIEHQQAVLTKVVRMLRKEVRRNQEANKQQLDAIMGLLVSLQHGPSAALDPAHGNAPGTQQQ